MEGLLELPGCACVEWPETEEGWGEGSGGVGQGEDRVPPRAQPQSTAALPARPSAAHLPASPPVRSPARWGSMAWSPLLGGPRAGGVGLLVLLLLALLRPPPAFCARPVKVRHQSGAGWGWAGGGCGLARVCAQLLAPRPRGPPPAPGRAGRSARGGSGGLRPSAPRPCRTRPAGVRCSAGSHALPTLGTWHGPGLAPQVACGAVHGTREREGRGCPHRSQCVGCTDWGVRMYCLYKCVSFDVSASERPCRGALMGLGVQ